MSRLQNICKPKGFWGKRMVKNMNKGLFAKTAEFAFSNLGYVDDGLHVLDIGCGGGANIKRWFDKSNNNIVEGIDYSEVSVKESIKLNKDNILKGNCKISLCDVCDMQYNQNTFDYISAFDTIYFWPQIEKNFKNVYNILKENGKFIICNESDGYDDLTIKASKRIVGMKLYKKNDLEVLLKEAGFNKIDFFFKNNIMNVIATK